MNDIEELNESSSRIRSMRSNDNNIKRNNSESWSSSKRSITKTSKEINNSFYENEYLIMGVLFIISCALIFYYYYDGTRPDNNSSIVDTSRNTNIKLSNLFNKDKISDSTSDTSDKTVTQIDRYFKDVKGKEKLVENIPDPSSSKVLDQLTNNEVNTSIFWSLPIALLSSRFFNTSNELNLDNNNNNTNQNNNSSLIIDRK
jgi:hypothetical protein